MNRCIEFKNNAGMNLAINEYKEGIDIEIETETEYFLCYSLSNNEKEKLIEFLLNKETKND